MSKTSKKKSQKKPAPNLTPAELAAIEKQKAEAAAAKLQNERTARAKAAASSIRGLPNPEAVRFHKAVEEQQRASADEQFRRDAINFRGTPFVIPAAVPVSKAVPAEFFRVKQP